MKLSVLLWILLPVLIVLFNPDSFGQPPTASARPPSINWIAGPATADLGGSAELTIPEGYRFVNADDGRLLLRAMNNPVPRALAGILTPLSGSWMIIFEASDPGYVKDSGNESLDAMVILKAIRERAEQQNQTVARQQGAMPISLLEWELKPEYDRKQHTVEWAVRAQSGQFAIVNHVVRMFGRRAMIDGIAVQPVKSAADVPLKDLMHGVKFKAGQAYADFQQGDKLSALGLIELITADDAFAEKAPNSKRPLIVLIASCSAVACFLGIIGVGYWAWRKSVRSQKAMMERFHLDTPATEARPAAKPAVAVAARSNGTVKEAAVKETAVKGALPKPPVVRQNRVNGKQNGHYSSRRRRIFDYQKYYSDLMLQVSDRAYDTANMPRRNGYNSRPVSSNGSAEKLPAQPVPATNMDLIASQMNLIEEQQRLIREQTRLIEEKSKLIHEKSQLLEKQIELFGNGVY